MGKLVYRHHEYIVLEDRRGHTIFNTNGTFENNHGHVKRLGTAKKLINLIEKRIVPDSSYLRETAIRISLDEKYKAKIRGKIKKDKNKNYYINVQKGVRK